MFSVVRLARLAAFAAAVAVASPATPAQAAQAAEKAGEVRFFVNVTGEDGTQLPIAPADMTIEEDGRPREVLRIEQATGPLQIALLVDDSAAAQSAISDLRRGVRDFIAKVLDASPETQIAVITFGERPTLLADYTNNRVLLERAANRIFSRPNSGAYMLEAIASATRGAKKRGSDRAHIVVIGTEGVEFSNDSYERVLDDLAASRASLWALTLMSGPRASDTDETRNRAIVLGRGTAASGGRQDQVLANSAITSRLDALAALLLNQYAVTFSRPASLVPPQKISVKVGVPGARVLAPETAPRPAHAGETK